MIRIGKVRQYPGPDSAGTAPKYEEEVAPAVCYNVSPKD
jgi:hypothetical protein